ncbi:MAG: addiction module protein [Bacteroidetes bacterium]|nr:addiction module protein [Bacteroidota bacterium]MBL7104393.1 addiction module protein [Bacteroidales bacterium]
MENTEALYLEALNLRPSERIHLIEMLAQSLDKSDEKIERVWAKESEERYYALTKGKVTTIPLEQIIEKYKQ